jgi:hypothetical protein
MWYKCKLAGKHYQYNLLDIDYYKTGNISINREYTTIDFSDWIIIVSICNEFFRL